MSHDSTVMLENVFQNKGVSVDRLVTLCRIAESEGITAAAGGDPVRQSQFSRQMKELEEGLGVRLIDRSVTPHRLTADGAVIEDLARGFLNRFDHAILRMKGLKLPVVIAAGESVIQWLLIPALSKLIGKDGQRIVFRNMTSKAASEAVKSAKVDIAILNSKVTADGMECRNLGEFGVRLIAQPNALLTMKVKSWVKLGKVPLAVMEGGGSLRKRVDDLVSTHDDGPFIALECTSHNQLLTSCATTNLIGVVPELASVHAKALGLKSFSLPELNDEVRSLSITWSDREVEARPELRDILNAL